MDYAPDINTYDGSYGIDREVIDYARESILVALRISPFRFYLLHRNLVGKLNGSAATPITVTQYSETLPNYRTIVWSSGANFPDLRPYANAITVLINGIPATRILNVSDLVNDNEFAVVRRVDLPSGQVEIVFNAGFNASLHVITYWYTTIQSGVAVAAVQSGDDSTESIFNWTQYLNPYCDEYQRPNQILVRAPLTTKQLIINEEGKVTLEENECWTLWFPYIQNFDLLILPGDQASSGVEERYDVINKKDSVMQHTLTSQRFHLKLINQTDPRYLLPYLTR
jgi:hypothetical protein